MKQVTKNVDMEKVFKAQELWKIAKKGDTTALFELADILKIKIIAVGFSQKCRKTSSSILEPADLEQDLMLCLLNCIRHYDDTKMQIPFYAYATRALKNECGKSKRKSFPINYTLYGAMKLASDMACSYRNDDPPIVSGRPSFIRVESFPMYTDEDGNDVAMEFDSCGEPIEDVVEKEVLFLEVRKMVRYIEDELEREIIQMKYGFYPYKRPHSAAEIAKKIGGISDRLVYSTIKRVLCRLVVEHCDLLMSA